MSLDINYYSFSPSRADKYWPEFREDLGALQKYHAPIPQREKKQRETEAAVAKIKAEYEKKFEILREEIFNFFKQREHYIPYLGMDWENPDSHDEKLQYLLNYGCTYPKGVDPKDKNAPYLMLPLHAPELRDKYAILQEEQGRALQALYEKNPLPETLKQNLTDRQKFLDEGAHLNYLIYNKKNKREHILSDLKKLDLFYGAIANQYFENPKLEETYLGAFIQVMSLKTVDGYPLKDEWLRLYKSLTLQIISQAAIWINQNEKGRDLDDWEGELRDYLRSVKPVVKDLNDTSDAIFLMTVNDNPEVTPQSVDTILEQRSQIHLKEYADILTEE